MKLINLTLGDVKNFCAKQEDCSNCPFTVKPESCLCELQSGAPEDWEFTPPRIESTIVWHKYPEELPPKKAVLCYFEDGHICTQTFGELFSSRVITAWAELPDMPLWDGD